MFQLDDRAQRLLLNLAARVPATVAYHCLKAVAQMVVFIYMPRSAPVAQSIAGGSEAFQEELRFLVSVFMSVFVEALLTYDDSIEDLSMPKRQFSMQVTMRIRARYENAASPAGYPIAIFHCWLACSIVVILAPSSCQVRCVRSSL